MSQELISGGIAFGSGKAHASLQCPELIDHLSAYKKRVAGNYRAILPEDIRTLPGDGFLVSTKIDGELWFLISYSGNIFFSNPGGKVIFGDLPILKAASHLPDGTIIAGELHVKVDNGRCRVGDLSALISKGAKADLSKLCFAAFDLVKTQESDTQLAYADRLTTLQKLLNSENNLFAVDSQEIDRQQLVDRFSSEVMSGQSEGLIARLPTGLIFKLKPAITIDAVVIAYSSNGEMARSLLLGLMLPDGVMQIFGGCGNLGTDENRKDLLNKLMPLHANSPIRYPSDMGSLFTFVRPQIVVEIKVTDLQADRSDGSPSKSMKVEFKENAWKGLGMASCPRPIHPVLIGIREDKIINVTDIRFQQIADYVSLPDLKSVDEILPTSTIIRREVWSKDSKGLVAIRKLLIWKTNKQAHDDGYPNFVVHWTDYSPGRASPLDKEVKLAQDEASANALAEAMVSENIKKGWEKLA